ncbi:MAG: hypothetical protein NTZ87_00130 [Candidatus Nomurabacteria bacterium]|nr:hypothetical protein [Candidatus Nomurabacteria bacterium]
MKTVCKNCKNDFILGDEEINFYKKVNVPTPQFCPDCRLQQRMIFRNERTLYKRKSDAPNSQGEIFSIFSPDSDQIVYDHKTWWGDSWDAMSFGQDIDFEKPFFEQLKTIWRKVPDVALLNINPVNSDYCSITEGNKNCYLVVGGDFNENVMYSSFTFNTRDSIDLHWVSKSDLCYESSDCLSSSRLLYSRQSDSCLNSAFLFNCRNCSDCFGCVNLRNASHCIFNEQFDKKTYEEKIKEMNLASFSQIKKFKKQFEEFILKYPHKFARVIKSINSTGDNLDGTKNCKNCFDVNSGVKDCGNIWLSYSAVSDCYDCDHFGRNSQECYQVSTVYPGNRVFFSRFIFDSHEIFYSYNCHNCSNLFGCVGLRNKSYCIFNKQYSKKSFEELKAKLIKHMEIVPYIDRKDRLYGYGDFFPADLSPFGYNETVAQELFPLTKKEAETKGYFWRERKERDYKNDMETKDLPDSLNDIDETITQKVIGCGHKGECTHECTKAYKITKTEFDFYKKMNIPLPRLCYNCRYCERIAKRNPIKLWKRKCECAGSASSNNVYKNTRVHDHANSVCEKEFETPYSPDRPEIVYCETCYQQEVY